jgi:hypothetical protein
MASFVMIPRGCGDAKRVEGLVQFWEKKMGVQGEGGARTD